MFENIYKFVTKNTLRTIIFILPCVALAQEKIKTFHVEADILYATVDRSGDLYIVLGNGTLRRYDKNGNPVASFSSTVSPTLFDPRDGARIFAYYRSPQHILHLGPQLNPRDTSSVDPAFAVDPLLICPGGDHHMWIVDGGDLSLKKINLRSVKLEAETRMEGNGDGQEFKLLREYQNFVFLLDKNGISIFNSIGIPIKRISGEEINSFNFLGEELYYFQGDHIHFLDLFTGETRDEKVDFAASYVVLTDERLFAIKERSVDIVNYKP